MVVFKMRESVPTARYSPVCNVLRQWKTSLILTYRVYRLYDIDVLILPSLTYTIDYQPRILTQNHAASFLSNCPSHSIQYCVNGFQSAKVDKIKFRMSFIDYYKDARHPTLVSSAHSLERLRSDCAAELLEVVTSYTQFCMAHNFIELATFACCADVTDRVKSCAQYRTLINYTS